MLVYHSLRSSPSKTFPMSRFLFLCTAASSLDGNDSAGDLDSYSVGSIRLASG
jgi:hypothetical protein